MWTRLARGRVDLHASPNRTTSATIAPTSLARSSSHKEQGDASNAKTGAYGYRDANGIFRTVKYVADANGFRATVDTNEPGTAPGASADAVFNANPVAAAAGASGRYAGAGGPWAG
ncbi:hypothetical protein MTO96_052217 [Rhipicephalus appendiculatus]